MSVNTKIYNRFTGYTLKDCDCRYCLYYGGKRKGCAIPRCCCEKERSQAAAREKMENYCERETALSFFSQDG